MPVMMSSYLLPLSPSLPFLVEDTYVKGGFRVVATFSDLGLIVAFAKKQGMLAYVTDEDKYYKLLADKKTWVEFKLGADLGDQLAAEDPILLVKQDTKYVIGLNPSQRIPAPPGAGYQLFSGPSGSLIWVDVTGTESRGQRVNVEYTAPDYITAGNFVDFSIPAHAAAMLISVTVNCADVMLQLFESNQRLDTNPYTFVSSADKLQDDGITVIDGKNVKTRRYSFLASSDDTKRFYGRFTNVGSGKVLPSLHITYLALE